MAAFFSNLRNAVVMGFVAAAIILAVRLSYGGLDLSDEDFWIFVLRWAHILCGIMWIGLLWYFNIMSAPVTAQIAAPRRPALDQDVAPAALAWRRWAALGAIVFGLLVAAMNGYLAQILSLDSYDDTGPFATVSYLLIGIGVWLGIIMAFNIWFLIWPNQRIVLSSGSDDSSVPARDKALAAQTAGLFSRINMLLSIPMLFCMVAGAHMP